MDVSEDFQRTIIQALEEAFQAIGSCSLELNPGDIREMIQDHVGVTGMDIIEASRGMPDIAGEVGVERPLPASNKKMVMIEAVDRAPNLEDVYRLKRYAEILAPDYAFLVAKQRFDGQLREYLEDHPRILQFLIKGTTTVSGAREITVGHVDEKGQFVIDTEVSPGNPFDPKKMWR
ncbi:hypothetical protein EU545_04005 [Candidatus Thorarchaeota archaeon]|nr:MAG: hypothetical protein EU545_04005 [Candidatus Thorarchaeota archaeon]